MLLPQVVLVSVVLAAFALSMRRGPVAGSVFATVAALTLGAMVLMVEPDGYEAFTASTTLAFAVMPFPCAWLASLLVRPC